MHLKLILAGVAIASLVVLISRVKLHPFVSLLAVSLALGAACRLSLLGTVKSFETGVGAVLGHTAIVIVLGAMLGKMLAESGGAECVAETIVSWFSEKRLPFAMLLAGLLIGLPVFFEVGFLLLMPIAFHIAKQTRKSIVLVALPMLAGLSIVHALIPPHPAAVAAVTIFGANLGRTMGFALIVGIPAALLAGPLYAQWIARRIDVRGDNPVAEEFLSAPRSASRPGFGLTVATLLLPVVLMLAGGWADTIARRGSAVSVALSFMGNPDVALLAGVLLSFVTFGLMQRMSREQIAHAASTSLGPVAGAMLMIGAGGGFGRVLQDAGVATELMQSMAYVHLPLLASAWLIAALLRVATGSSTVAMITAAGIVAPVAVHAPSARPELLAIAVGAGSIVLSHVNDGGFWLVKEYLNLSVGETFASWTVCETILSVTGLALVLALAAV
jgi:GntP family gluconate:H+ symporter